MNSDADISAALQQRVREAAARGEALRVTGGGTKDFYGRRTAGEPLAAGGHRGILDYEPTELVITARAGTPLA
ncbi:MAG: glycolate oxidase subunit GlcE, partial [Gammaproteobacteria bacterium]|nr:glycolate oxidase subunit GlcE [Gammaproteobacteria bacterium]